MRYRYAGVIAVDPNTELTTVVRSASGTVHTNEQWDTPTTVYDINGFPMNSLNTTAEGLFPDFYVDHHPVVGFQTNSGHRFYLVSSTPQPGTPGPAANEIVGEDGYFKFRYPDGTEVQGPALPEAVKGDDGVSPTITFDTTTTLAAGANAYATYTWDGPNPMIKLHLPRGAKGDPGDANHVYLTQAAYDALATKDNTKTYFIIG